MNSMSWIVWIAFACVFYYTAMAWFRHRERMAKIQRGIEPDQNGDKDMT